MQERTIFFEALDRSDPVEREAYLARACADNPSLRGRIETLLNSADSDFLHVPFLEQLGISRCQDTDKGSSALTGLHHFLPTQRSQFLGRLGHYELEEVVGYGGTGVVLRARDEKLHRTVAVKILLPLLLPNPSARERFMREARTFAAVSHDNIVSIYAVEESKSIPYLVMQFVDGQSLQELINQSGPLPLGDVLRIGAEVATGLAAAHAQGLVHRDVKPANILLTKDGHRVKMTDFGLACAVEDATLSRAGDVVGTPAYMSPEQAHGETVDCRSDLFSLGSVLYEMTTGVPAFHAASTLATIKCVCENEVAPVRNYNPSAPAALCQLIATLLAKNPVNRPTDAANVAQRLKSIQAHVEGSIAPATPLPLLSAASPAPVGRAKRWRAVFVAVALATLFGIGYGETTGQLQLFSTVLRLLTPDGTLVVEVDDPDIRVALDNSDVVFSGAGVSEFRLKPGQYRLAASKDGKTIRQDLVTITRNGRQIVRIRRETDALDEATRQWEEVVASLPAEHQVQAVTRRLKELNPQFDGNVSFLVEGNVVTEIRFLTDQVSDISPVHALKNLNVLHCTGSRASNGKLADLSPLRGLSLVNLVCGMNRIEDLSPLVGMPLSSLECQLNSISDLTPLSGMKLRHFIGSYNPVRDIGALRGLPLQSVELDGFYISDITPLQGMQLNWLSLCESRSVTNVSVVQNMPLVYLNLTGLPIGDDALIPISNLPQLRHLVLDDTLVSDLTLLGSLPIQVLSVQRSRVTQMSAIAKLPLKRFRLDYQPERDHNFLKSLPELVQINDLPVEQFWRQVDSTPTKP